MNISKARKRSGMTQEDLAQRIGVNRATLSKYETGQIEPSISMLRKICNVLECSLQEIMSNEEMEFRLMHMISNANRDIDWEMEYKIQVMSTYFRMLNTKGQIIAVERVKELTKIPEYQRTDSAGLPETPTEGNTPTTQEKPPEGQIAPSDGK